MPLDTWAEWETRANDTRTDPAALRALRDGPVPGSYALCLADPAWRALLRLYLEDTSAVENLDFLDSVEEFRAYPSANAAGVVFERYLRDGAQDAINIDYGPRQDILKRFAEDDHLDDAALFDRACDAVRANIEGAFYSFQGLANRAGQEARTPTEDPAAHVIVDDPDPLVMGPDHVDRAVVDTWNETALKSLVEKETTLFYEIGDLVIIDARQPAGVQPYVNWASTATPRPGQITMTKKGGAFGPGSIAAARVQNAVVFEAAVRRVSKKEVVLV
jgi:Regulator of G protein signaling domain